MWWINFLLEQILNIIYLIAIRDDTVYLKMQQLFKRWIRFGELQSLQESSKIKLPAS